jgi:hypothetical protein
LHFTVISPYLPVTFQEDVEKEVQQFRLRIPANDEDDVDDESPVESVDNQQEKLYAGWTFSPYTKQASLKLKDKVAIYYLSLSMLV